MEKKEDQAKNVQTTEQKDLAKESSVIKNANAAGDGAIERQDTDLSEDKNKDQKTLESKY